MIMYIDKNDFLAIISGYLDLIRIIRPISPRSKRKELDKFSNMINELLNRFIECDGITFLEKD